MKSVLRMLASAFLSAAIVLVPVASAVNQTQDTDGDGLPDVQEDANGNNVLDPGETDPYNADTDGGGESDGSEVAAQRNPFDKTDDMTYDADGDGWVNGIEILHNTDPKNADTDGDGVMDSKDPFPLDSKFQTDTNANNLPDEWEQKTGLDQQQVTQTTVDDPDHDGLSNAEELARGTNPLNADTDRDGIDDKTEIDAGTDPRENACLAYAASNATFTDMGNHWATDIVRVLQGVMILPDNTPLIRGYVDGTLSAFHPDQAVTRYEFLKMVMLSSCIRLRNDTDHLTITFNDVLKGSSLVNERADVGLKRKIIYTAAQYKVVEGYEDGSFRPDAQVNRAEALKILNLAVQFGTSMGSGAVVNFADVTPDDWFAPYVLSAASRGIVSGYGDGTFGPGNPITRAEAAKIIWKTMEQNPLVNGYVLPLE